jgi:hypothetical protein
LAGSEAFSSSSSIAAVCFRFLFIRIDIIYSNEKKKKANCHFCHQKLGV